MAHLTIGDSDRQRSFRSAFIEHTPLTLYTSVKETDYADLFDTGVNYNYQGKTWNVRFGIEYKDDSSIANIFARCHCDNKIRGYSFHAISNTHYESSWIEYDAERPHLIRKISSDEGGFSKGGMPPSTLSNIVNGERIDDIEEPQILVTEGTKRSINGFFSPCPELALPILALPIFDRQPDEPNEPTQVPLSETSSSYWRWAVASSLFVIATVYLVVKYYSQESVQNPTKSSTI